jgi:hypothetical protein
MDGNDFGGASSLLDESRQIEQDISLGGSF